MTVLDTSAVVDFLVGSGAAEEVRAILGGGAPPNLFGSLPPSERAWEFRENLTVA